jgi:hypothetical protein
MAKRSSKALPTPDGAGDRKLLADVKQFGWHVIKVAADLPTELPKDGAVA